MAKLGEFLVQWTERFAQAGIVSPRLDARLLAAHVLDMDPLQVAMQADMELSADQLAGLMDIFSRRLTREPVSHILGRRGFWTLDLKVTSDTLDPRGDTETLIEAVLALAPKDQDVTIFDFGTGTGAIVLALASELPRAKGVGIDISPKALDVARENAKRNGLDQRVSFHLGHWGQGLDGLAHIVVSNPPYIPDAEVDTLEPEVRDFEPHLALKGGRDGLDCYRELIPLMFDRTLPAGIAAVEIGKGQEGDVAALFEKAGFVDITTHRDLAGIIRVVMAQKPEYL